MINELPGFIGDRERSGLNRTLREMRQAQAEHKESEPAPPPIMTGTRRCERCGQVFPVEEMHVMEYYAMRSDCREKPNVRYQRNYRYFCHNDWMIKKTYEKSI